MQERISVYWDFYNPAYLFFAGGSNLTNSTRRVGVFLLPMAVLLAVGISHILTAKRNLINLTLLLGFVTAPLAACVIDERDAVDRELELLPFAVLIAALGVEYLLAAGRRIRLERCACLR